MNLLFGFCFFFIIIPKCPKPEFAYMKRVLHICELCLHAFYARIYIAVVDGWGVWVLPDKRKFVKWYDP